MNKLDSSPTFKNIKSKKLHSPIQLKEKIRKVISIIHIIFLDLLYLSSSNCIAYRYCTYFLQDYKHKVQSCRDILLCRLRGSPLLGKDLHTTLTDIYNETFSNFNKDAFQELLTNNEETKILEEIKMELIQNELSWYVTCYLFI